MQALTLILPYFCNRNMLLEHQRVWADYPADLRKCLHVIVVDSGSPPERAARAEDVTIQGMGSIRLYRILKHIPWNWLAARNLGMLQARTSWRLMTDIDHLMPPETAEAITTMPLDGQNAYRVARVDAPRPWPFTLAECPVREDRRFHPNTWLLTGKLFEATGGYDERLAGCYGTDGEYRDRVRDKAKAFVHVQDVLIRYAREVVADASTTIYPRKNNPVNDDELRRRREARALIPNWKPLRGTFPWQQVV